MRTIPPNTHTPEGLFSLFTLFWTISLCPFPDLRVACQDNIKKKPNPASGVFRFSLRRGSVLSRSWKIFSIKDNLFSGEERTRCGQLQVSGPRFPYCQWQVLALVKGVTASRSPEGTCQNLLTEGFKARMSTKRKKEKELYFLGQNVSMTCLS